MSKTSPRPDVTAPLQDEACDGPSNSSPSEIPAEKPPEYSVGYGRPPVGSRFKPGQSGNPKGRPKGSRNVLTELREVYTDTIVIHVEGKKRRVTRLTALLLGQWERSVKGSERATKEAMANAQTLGVFDEPKAEEPSRPDGYSDEFFESLSAEERQQLIDIERKYVAKTMH